MNINTRQRGVEESLVVLTREEIVTNWFAVVKEMKALGIYKRTIKNTQILQQHNVGPPLTRFSGGSSPCYILMRISL